MTAREGNTSFSSQNEQVQSPSQFCAALLQSDVRQKIMQKKRLLDTKATVKGLLHLNHHQRAPVQEGCRQQPLCHTANTFGHDTHFYMS